MHDANEIIFLKKFSRLAAQCSSRHAFCITYFDRKVKIVPRYDYAGSRVITVLDRLNHFQLAQGCFGLIFKTQKQLQGNCSPSATS